MPSEEGSKAQCAGRVGGKAESGLRRSRNHRRSRIRTKQPNLGRFGPPKRSLDAPIDHPILNLRPVGFVTLQLATECGRPRMAPARFGPIFRIAVQHSLARASLAGRVPGWPPTAIAHVQFCFCVCAFTLYLYARFDMPSPRTYTCPLIGHNDPEPFRGTQHTNRTTRRLRFCRLPGFWAAGRLPS